MQEAWVRPLHLEEPQKKEMAIRSSTLAWEIPCTEKSGRLQPMGLKRDGHDLATKQHRLTLKKIKIFLAKFFKT